MNQTTYQKSTSLRYWLSSIIGGDSMIWNLWMTTIVDQIQNDVAVVGEETLSIIDTLGSHFGEAIY